MLRKRLSFILSISINLFFNAFSGCMEFRKYKISHQTIYCIIRTILQLLRPRGTNITCHKFSALNCLCFISPGTCFYGFVSDFDFTVLSRTKCQQSFCKCLVKKVSCKIHKVLFKTYLKVGFKRKSWS